MKNIKLTNQQELIANEWLRHRDRWAHATVAENGELRLTDRGPVKLLYVLGASGSGKSQLVRHIVENEFPRMSIVSKLGDDFGKLIHVVDWCNLDDSFLELSLAQSIAPGASNLCNAIKEVTNFVKGEVSSTYALLIVNDFELAMTGGRPSEESKRVLTRIVQSVPEGRSLDIVITATRRHFVSWLPEEIVLAPPMWDDDAFGSRPKEFACELCKLLNSDESESFVKRICRPTVIALKILSRLGESELAAVLEGFTAKLASLRVISKLTPEALVDPGDPFHLSEVQVRLRSEFLAALHKILYERHLLQNGDPRYRELVFKLVNWASVDPGFDFWRQCASQDLKRNVESVLHEDYCSDEMFFRLESGTKAPRLAHSSALDMYGSHLNTYRILDHSTFARQFAAAQGACSQEFTPERLQSDRLKIAELRHLLRCSTENRDFGMLARLDAEQFNDLGLSSHELAYAKRDFIAPWSESEIRSRSRLNHWYTPPCLPKGNITKECLTAARLLYAEAAYQALDDWDVAEAGSREFFDHLSAISASSSVADVDNWFLIHGLAATMMYEVGPEAQSWSELSYKISRKCLTQWEETCEENSAMKEKFAVMSRSVEANAVLAALKCFPASVPFETFLDSSFSAALNQVQTRHQEFFDRCEAYRSAQRIHDLDQARELLVFARYDFLNDGHKSHGWRDALNLVLRFGGTSQERVYAFLQWKQNLLYAYPTKYELAIPRDDSDLLTSTEDNWARYQFEFVRLWEEYLNGSMTTEPTIYELVQLARRFDGVDSKATRTCLWSAAYLKSTLERSPLEDAWHLLLGEVLGMSERNRARSVEDLIEGDRFYSVVYRCKCCEENLRFGHWFGDYWVKCQFAPVMPAALALRGQPYGYVPRAE